MDLVKIETRENGVAVVTLNRPEALNALDFETRQSLSDIFQRFSGNDEVKVVVLTGGEGVFAAGADIKAMAKAYPIDIIQKGTHRLWTSIADFPKPIIASVNGYALGGGCELAMHSDIIVAGEGAQFGQPEVKLGIMPGAGGTQRLIRAVGKFRAMRMLLSGEIISADEAYTFGLVSKVVPDSETLNQAVKMAERISRMSTLAVQQIKEVALAGMNESLDVAMRLERKAFQLLFSTKDQKEGMAAFIEKRKPVFKGE